MSMPKKTIPFKIEKTKELITPNSGLSIYMGLCKALDVEKSITKLFPKPGSGKGFEANAYVMPILGLFLAGGKYLEDIRKIKLDKALQKIGSLNVIPSADAIGNWLRNKNELKCQAIQKLDKMLTERFLNEVSEKTHTLDIDAFSIFSEKDTAKMTYKGEYGYMPMVGHLADCDWCVGFDFREGNVAPAAKNLEFIQYCFEQMPKDHQITACRSDSAAYQADIFNFLDQKGVKFTITGVQNKPMIAEITRIPENSWVKLYNKDGFPTGREVAQTYTCMEETDYFRIVVQRWVNPRPPELFEPPSPYCYHIVCTNYAAAEKTAQQVIYWHNQRANSENYHKEAKSGFNLQYLPCGDFKANALWFALGLLAYNLHVFAKQTLLPTSWRKKTIASIRWEFIHIAGKVVSHSGSLILRLAGVSDALLQVFRQAKQRCLALVPT